MGILVSEGNATYIRNDVWKNDITLMTDTIEKSPNHIRPYITLSVAYIALQEYDKALKYLKIAENLYNNNKQLYQENWIGLVYYNAAVVYAKETEKKDEDKALRLLMKGYLLFPYDFDTNIHLGLLLFKKGDFAKSEEVLSNAANLKEYLPVNYYNMYGRVLYANDKLDEAIEVFKKGLDTKRTSEIQLNLVAAYLKKNDIKSAEIILRGMPVNDNDPVYLLYKALLNRDSIRKISLEKVADFLIANNTGYCEWLDSIYENKAPGIIYPDIHLFEDFLREKYINNVNRVRVKLEETVSNVKECSAVQVNTSETASAN
jgi:tetratricopeptide (TPR) repeat protein